MTAANPIPARAEVGAESAAAQSSIFVSLIQLTKPGVLTLVMVTALAGALVAPGQRDALILIVALYGTALVVGSANALNMYLERHSDAFMSRTRNRPLPSGRLAPETALIFGLALSAIGLPLLALIVNPLSALLTAAALGSYVLVYTPLKQQGPIALLVGAVPGAIPPLIGWASVEGSLSGPAWALFAILFVWQLPHFLAIAIFRREEYARAGHKVLPVVRGVQRTKVAIVGYALLLFVTTLLPYALEMVSFAYFVAAATSGLLFVAYAVRGLREGAGDAWARRLFRFSMPHLVLVMSAFVLTARM